MSKIHTTVRVGVDGSLTLPAFFMRGMGYEPGEEVPITTPANQYICDCDANRLLVTRTCDDAECTGLAMMNGFLSGSVALCCCMGSQPAPETNQKSEERSSTNESQTSM